jgi:metal-dependent amidase/aminoacylase/carboxypeptidase family protein
VMASQAVLALQTIRLRTLRRSGERRDGRHLPRGGANIIPGEVLLEGTVRTYSEAARDRRAPHARDLRRRRQGHGARSSSTITRTPRR